MRRTREMRDSPAPIDAAGIERPLRGAAGNAMFGSDVVAETLRALGMPYIALTPGASFRGLHDSLVNHLGNERPQMLLCLHEEQSGLAALADAGREPHRWGGCYRLIINECKPLHLPLGRRYPGSGVAPPTRSRARW